MLVEMPVKLSNVVFHHHIHEKNRTTGWTSSHIIHTCIEKMKYLHTKDIGPKIVPPFLRINFKDQHRNVFKLQCFILIKGPALVHIKSKNGGLGGGRTSSRSHFFQDWTGFALICP